MLWRTYHLSQYFSNYWWKWLWSIYALSNKLVNVWIRGRFPKFCSLSRQGLAITILSLWILWCCGCDGHFPLLRYFQPKEYQNRCCCHEMHSSLHRRNPISLLGSSNCACFYPLMALSIYRGRFIYCVSWSNYA